ncbi:MAG: fibronectin type III domain-containing protein, partial [Tunicatimonas sp.]
NENLMNGVVGLSPAPAGAYGELAIIVRFNDQGFIDARDGSSYTATNAVSYTKDVAYQVKTEVDLSTATYNVYVTPAGGEEQTVGENFAFRTEQASATELGYYNINTEICRLSVTDFAIFSPGGSEVPYAPTAAVKPVLENGGNVTPNGDGTYTATFGYYNQNDMGVNIPVGENNRFSPTPQDRGQTTTFRRGRQREVFSVILQPGETVVWTLKGPNGRRRTSTATAPPPSPIPTPPTNLTADNVTETTVDLSWTASIDDQGVVKYEVLKDTQWDQSVFGAPPSSMATVTGLAPGTTYLFYVKAFDADGNASSNSQSITVTTDGGGAVDADPPSQPTDLVASNTTSTSVDLNWAASTDNEGVVKYEVLKDTQWDQSVFGAPPSPSATVTGLTPGTTYIFYVAAFDANRNRSSNSQVVTVTTPSDEAARSEVATTKDKPSSPDGMLEAVTVYPNPVEYGPFVVQMPTTKGAHLSLYDQQGRRILISVEAGAQHLTVSPTRKLAGGLYLLRLRQANGTLVQKKLMVQ